MFMFAIASAYALNWVENASLAGDVYPINVPGSPGHYYEWQPASLPGATDPNMTRNLGEYRGTLGEMQALDTKWELLSYAGHGGVQIVLGGIYVYQPPGQPPKYRRVVYVEIDGSVQGNPDWAEQAFTCVPLTTPLVDYADCDTTYVTTSVVFP